MLTTNTEPRWYIVHTYAQYEAAVKRDIENMVETMGLQDQIFDVEIPVYEEIVEKDGKRKSVTKKKYPCYVFIKMLMNENLWYYVTHIAGVTGFLGTDGEAIPVTEEETKRMGLEKVSIEEFDVKVGDEVKILSNDYLANTIGVVEHINVETEKVKVSLNFMGRSITMNLDLNQVEKLA